MLSTHQQQLPMQELKTYADRANKRLEYIINDNNKQQFYAQVVLTDLNNVSHTFPWSSVQHSKKDAKNCAASTVLSILSSTSKDNSLQNDVLLEIRDLLKQLVKDTYVKDTHVKDTYVKDTQKLN